MTYIYKILNAMKIVTIVLKISKKLYCYIPKYVDDEFHPICISGDAFLRRCHLQSLWIRKYGDILEYWKLLLNRKMFLKTLAKRRQKQCFAFPLTVEKICLTIFSVSLASSKLFQALPPTLQERSDRVCQLDLKTWYEKAES